MKPFLLALLSLGIAAGAELPAPPLQPCPILMEQIHPRWAWGYGGDPWNSYLMVKFRNTSDKTIVSIRFRAAFIDSFGEEYVSVYYYDADSKIKPGKSSHSEWPDGVYVGEWGKTRANVWMEKVLFSDGTSLIDDGTHTCGAHTN